MLREARESDLKELLRLYVFLKDEPLESEENARAAWKEILADERYHVVVYEHEDKLVSSCTILTVPNLTHSCRPYAVIENVVTDEAYRGKGYATRCLQMAKKIAMQANCYKIMLMTGSRNKRTLSFYERAGYNSFDKTAFIIWL